MLTPVLPHGSLIPREDVYRVGKERRKGFTGYDSEAGIKQ
jgi:hypothetical protein